MVQEEKNTKFTEEQYMNEANYYRSLRILKNMLEKNLISKKEFKKIDKLNIKSFKPYLAQILS